MKLNKAKIPVIINLVKQGKSREEISTILGVRHENLRDYCYKYEISIPTIVKTNFLKRTNKINFLAKKGFSREEIAKELNITLNSLIFWAARNKITLPSKTITESHKHPGNMIIKSHVPCSVASLISQEARSRKVGVKKLTSDLLACIAEGKLYDAVLDQ